MKVNVGSKNPAKIKGVKEAFSLYFQDLIIKGIDVDSEVNPQPKKLEEITQGAINRAIKCFNDCNYSVGIESGIFPDEKALTGYTCVSRCVIYNGKEIVGIGLSPGFEHLPEIIERVLNEKSEIGQVSDDIINEKNLNQKLGGVGILSKGKYIRKDLIKAGTIMALLPIINQEHYA